MASIIQEVFSDDAFGGGTTQVSPALGVAATIGSTIEVWITTANVTALPTVVDSASQVYTQQSVSNDTTANQSLALFVFQNNASATALTVTATYGSSISGKGIWVKEIGGVTASSLNNDTTSNISSPGTGTDAVAGTAISPSSAPVFCSSLCMECLIGNGSDIAAGTGYTLGTRGWAFGGPNTLAASEFKSLATIVSTAATYTAATNGGTGSYLIGLSMYNPSATGATLAWIK
jgi:hypothetical protein